MYEVWHDSGDLASAHKTLGQAIDIALPGQTINQYTVIGGVIYYTDAWLVDAQGNVVHIGLE